MLTVTMNVLVIVLVVAILEMLRRKSLREKYAIVWLTMAATILIAAAFPNYLNQFSRFLGFQFLSNFVLLFFGVVNLIVVMHLSIVVGKIEDQNQTLAEEIALLKEKIAEDSH
jgi:hypothetical protein